jgi:sec-independent protein translocase protein TatA
LAFLPGSIGPFEFLIIMTVALMLFGAKRVPEIARKIGSTMAELRRASDELRHQVTREINVDEAPPASRQTPRAIAPAEAPPQTEPRTKPDAADDGGEQHDGRE